MRWRLGILALVLPAEAMACIVYRPLTAEDYAAAEIVVEAELIAMRPEIRRLPPLKKGEPFRESVTSQMLEFRVDRVIRGDLEPDERVWAGWIHGTYGHPSSIAEFDKEYGRYLRVGLERHSDTTGPELVVINGMCSGPYMLPLDSDKDGLGDP